MCYCWKGGTLYIHSHISNAELDIVQHCTHESFQLLVFKQVPVSVREAVLQQHGKCIFGPGCSGLCGGPGTATERGLGWGRAGGTGGLTARGELIGQTLNVPLQPTNNFH